ncbi:hypothetical protein ACO0RG_001165 [Hanseniaspora osmophila]|uniref:Regulator of rDNA transcription 14 n=1 Tax=Hanseniaspora osmophila TaxID=56408 RepID=A0A1E5RPA1_9ASCO|nr:Regulator of rDNA transcription 14 [Hanseniaspora osmophila]
MSTSRYTENFSKKLVSDLLDSVLPGVSNLSNVKSKNSSSRSKTRRSQNSTQLINENLKKRVLVDDFNPHSIIKKSKLRERKLIKSKQKSDQWYKTQAKINLLKEHYEKNNLTEQEQQLLKQRIDKQVSLLKTWELDEEMQEELADLQDDILHLTEANKHDSKRRRLHKKSKTFKSSNSRNKAHSKNTSVDSRYAGLTPGLAPVGLDDEEESSDEGY